MSQPVVRIFVKPTNENVLVRNPERNRHLLKEGELVTYDAYWLRRMNDGDVVEAAAPEVQDVQVSREAGKPEATKKNNSKTNQE